MRLLGLISFAGWMLHFAPLLTAQSLANSADQTQEQPLPPRQNAPRKAIKEMTTNDGFFRIESVDGVALYRMPLAVRTRQIKAGDVLPYGSELSIPNSASISLTYFYHSWGDLQSVQTYLSLRSSVTVELDRNILRKVKIKKEFYSYLKSQKAMEGPDSENPGFFRNAWKKVAVMLNEDKNSIYSKQLKASDTSDSKIAIRAKKISILYPQDGLQKYINEFPANLPVLWAHPTSKPMTYHIFLWRFNTDFSSPLAVTSDDNYNIRINEPGSYYFQISSKDGKYSSRPYMVHFIDDLPNQDTAGELASKSVLKPIFPNQNAWLPLAANEKTPIFWDHAPELQADKVTINVMDMATNQPRAYKATADKSLQLPLPPGNYQWWMEADSIETKTVHDKEEKVSIRKYSPKIGFEIVNKPIDDRNFMIEVEGHIANAIKNNLSTQIYLNDF